MLKIAMITAAVFATSALSGCQTTGPLGSRSSIGSLDLSYAQTSEGFINSGLQQFGSLYLLDTTPGKERLDKLDVLSFQDSKTGSSFSKVTAKLVSPATITAGLDLGLKASLNASLKNEATVELTNVTSVEALKTKTELSSLLNADATTGSATLADAWSLPEAVRKGSPLRLLLIYTSYLADEATFSVGKGPKVAGSITLPNGHGGNVSVNLEGTNLSSLAGKQVPVLHRYRVMKVVLRNTGTSVNYDFEIDKSFDMRRLPGILKSALN